MLLSAIRENRCGWRRAQAAEVADLSAMELRGYVVLRWLPEQETFFADESDPHQPLPGSLTVEPTGLYWKPTPEGRGWFEQVQALASERRAADDAEAAIAPRRGAAQPAGPVELTKNESASAKSKRSTERGEGRLKLIAALTKHHQYADGGCLNLEPVGCNELAKAAGVSPSTASAFFNDKFQGHTKYKALCRDAGKLTAALKLLNDEFAPYHLLGAASSDLAAPEQDDADSD